MIPDVLIVFADESALRNIGTYVRPYETPCEAIDERVAELFVAFDFLCLSRGQDGRHAVTWAGLQEVGEESAT